MVWIHGGSNIRGQGSTFLAGTLATTQNVIVVTINYRLGALGWFRHPSLRAIAANEEDRSGNYGLLDIIAALAWLRENISAFGGNAQKITIIGESAGAWNVCALLVSPKASGLFHRAIIQSGSIVTFDPQASENYTDDTIAGDPQSTGELLLQLILRDKLAKDRDGAKAAVAAMSDRKIAEYLREKSPLDLEKIYQKIRLDNQLSVLQFPVLFRDGVVLPATGIDNALVAGEFNKVPVIFGATKDEYTLLLTLSPNTPFIQKDRNSIGIKIQDRKQFNRAVHYLNLFFKMASVYEPINRITRFQPNQSFAYSFNWNYLLPAPLMDNIELGATHGIDVIFLFGKENVGPEFLQVPLIDGQFIGSYQKLSNAVMSYWAAFADSGNPGCGRKGELPLWEHWCPNQAAGAMILDDPEKGGLRMDHHPLRKADVFRELASDSFFSSAYSRNEFLQNIHTIGMRFSLINKLDYTNFCAFAHADGTRHK
jgi:para-nitrobenzyl esterase